MVEKAISCQIRAFAIMVEVEGMKAFNKERSDGGLSLAYSPESFSYWAEELNKLSKEAIQDG